MKVSEKNSNKTKLVLITNPDFKEPHLEKTDQQFHPLIANILDTFNNTEYLDIDYKHIRDIENKQPVVDTIYVCDMEGKSAYQHLEFLEITRSQEKVYITAEVNFKVSEWNAKISLLSFTQSIRDEMNANFSVFSDQQNLFDEDLLHIKFKVVTTKDHNLSAVIEQFAVILEKVHSDIFAKHEKQQLYLAC